MIVQPDKLRVSVVIASNGRGAGKTHLARKMERMLRRYRNPHMVFEIKTQVRPGARRITEFRGAGLPWGRG